MDGRKCYATADEALAGAVAQMDIGKSEGFESSTKRYQAMSNAAAESELRHRQLMSKLKRNIAPVKTLNPQELGDLILHGVKPNG